MVAARAMLREELKQRGVPQVFFQISALVQIFGIDFRHRQAVPAEMPGKLQERDVLFAHVVQNADNALAFSGQAGRFCAPNRRVLP